MTVEQILKIVYISIAFLTGAIPALIGWIQAIKNKKKAKTEEEKAIAQQEMLDKANELIANAETFFKALDSTLRTTTGETAGIYKKESVMSKLQAYAISKGIKFDADYWSAKIDEIVKLTKNVNAK